MENAHAITGQAHQPGLLERAHVLAAEHKTKLAAAVMAGGIALLGTGCTSPEEVPQQADVSAPTAPKFKAEPGIDQLPLVSDIAESQKAGRNDFVNGGLLNYLIMGGSSEDYTNYTYLMNKDEATGKQGDDLPMDESAPLLDVKMGPDGKLHYKDFLDNTSSDREDGKLATAVQDAAPLINAAMKSGEASTVHFRIFAPNKYASEHPEWEATASAQYIPIDYNDGGKPSIYYFLAPESMQDTETIALELRHEAGHGLMGQRKTNDNEDIPVTGEEREVYTEACNVLREQALTNIQQSGYHILSDLYDMRELTKKKYQSMYTKVINAIENDTYTSLERSSQSNARSAVPACYTQGPFEAVMVQAHKAKAVSMDEMLKDTNDQEQFEEVAGEMIDEWHDLFKQDTVYEILSESAYQTADDEHKQWGHPYDNSWELSASSTNLLLSVPDTFGENVSELTDRQKDVVNKMVAFNVAKLKQTHANDAEFQKYIDAQYAIYQAEASK